MQDSVCFLIDDDYDDHEIFSIALKNADKSYKCITAKSGIEALEKLHSDKTFLPGFIFLDLNMPLMSGKQCLAELKKIPRLKQTPVIIYTTSSYEKDIQEVKELGAAHFFVKPSSLDSLTKILSKLFKKQALSFSLNAELKN